jgi:hypothetical protein
MKKIPSPRAVFVYGLLTGVFFNDMFWMCWFDLNGKEGSIQKIREAWTDSDISMPLQIVAMVTVGMMVVRFWARLPSRKRLPPSSQ